MRLAHDSNSSRSPGDQVPDIDDEDIREIVVDGYHIFYLFIAETDRVEIVTLRHSSEQFGT